MNAVVRQRARLGRLAVAALVLIAGSSLSADAASLAGVYRRCLDACPEVLISGRHVGTAWVAGTDGSVVTAGHLFEIRQPQIELLFADNRRVAARLVAVDRGHDLALLEVDRSSLQAKPLKLAARPPEVGDEVYQFGAPLFRSGTLQPGRVAGEQPKFEFQASITDYAEGVSVAAMMQGGTSGGPWLNRRGEVVGVQSSTVSLDGKPVGLAFMAPAPAIQRLLKTRISAETPTPGLGVDELWQQSPEFLEQLPAGTRGLVAAVVREKGPAASAGVIPRDVLIEADGQPLVRIADLPRAVRRHRPGATVEFVVLRPGESDLRRLKVVLGRAEDLWLPDGPAR
jgi:serine protease Do